MHAIKTVRLAFSRIPMEIFTPILGMGVDIPMRIGISLKQMLCDQLKMPLAYLEQRIQTILVNGHAVDQVDTLVLADGDIIALSAAMPGLAGAILRKGGALSPMRAAISQAPSAGNDAAGQMGTVRLKLFNMVAREMGPQILAQGVWLQGKIWAPIAAALSQSHHQVADIGPDEWISVIVDEKKE